MNFKTSFPLSTFLHLRSRATPNSSPKASPHTYETLTILPFSSLSLSFSRSLSLSLSLSRSLSLSLSLFLSLHLCRASRPNSIPLDLPAMVTLPAPSVWPHPTCACVPASFGCAAPSNAYLDSGGGGGPVTWHAWPAPSQSAVSNTAFYFQRQTWFPLPDPACVLVCACVRVCVRV